MTYTTKRGVTTYSDRDTPAEYVSSADEERDAYNKAQDLAAAAAENLCCVLDALYEPPAGDMNSMRRALEKIADALAALEAEVVALVKGDPA